MKYFRNLTKSKFARNVAIVAGGTAMAQAVGVVFTPVITRIYGPESFGLLGIFLSLTTIVTSVSALTYPNAIVLPRQDREAKSIAALSIYISFIMAFLATIIIFIYGDQLFILIGAQAITAFALLIPLKMLFTAWLETAQQWLIRKKQFKQTAKIEVAQSLIINTAKTSIGFFNPIAAVLITIATIGAALHAFMLYLNTRKGFNQVPETEENFRHKSARYHKLALRYYDFPLYRAPQVLINSISLSLPVLMLAAISGPASAGFYVLGKKLLKAPTKLIGKSVAKVFYPKITNAAQNGKNLRKLIASATLGLAVVGFLPYSAVVIWGPGIFEFVFGEEWIMAGEYARWMAFMLFFQFINKPSVVATATLGLQKGLLIYEITSTALRLLALYAGFEIFKNDLAAVALFSISSTIMYLLLILWIIIAAGSFSNQQRFDD